MKIKNLVTLLMTFLVSASVCYAQNMKVSAVDEISTKNKGQLIKVKVLETMQLSDSITIEEGSIVEGKMVNVVSAKRMKKNTTFSFAPQQYTLNNQTVKIDGNFVGKYSPRIDFDTKTVATSAALSVGNHFVK